MIVGSLLLILVAVTLLVLGLASGSSSLLISSIAASLLAAVALVVGARQAAAARGDIGFAQDGVFPGDGEPIRGGGVDGAGEPRRRRPPTNTRSTRFGPAEPTDPYGSPEPLSTDPVEVTVPSQGTPAGADSDRGWRQPASGPTGAGPGGVGGAAEDDVPPDEPPAQQVSAADAARVAQLAVDVYVVDGRPRYHLVDCPHLSGRETEPLPVAEAVELGFTPCGRCEPDRALLANLPRR